MKKSKVIYSLRDRWNQFYTWLLYYGPERSSLLAKFAFQKLIIAIALVVLRPFSWIVFPEKMDFRGFDDRRVFTWATKEYLERHASVSIQVFNTLIWKFTPAFAFRGRCYYCAPLQWVTISYPSGISAIYNGDGKVLFWFKQDASSNREYFIKRPEESPVPEQIYCSYSLPFVLRDYTDAIALAVSLGAIPYPSLPKKDSVYFRADVVLTGIYRYSTDQARPKTGYELGYETWYYPEPEVVAKTYDSPTYANMWRRRRETLSPDQFYAEDASDMIALAVPVVFVPVPKPEWLDDPDVTNVFAIIANGKHLGVYAVFSKKPAPPEDNEPHMKIQGQPHYYLEIGTADKDLKFSNRFKDIVSVKPLTYLFKVFDSAMYAGALLSGAVALLAVINEAFNRLAGLSLPLPWETYAILISSTFAGMCFAVAAEFLNLVRCKPQTYEVVLSNLWGPGDNFALYKLYMWLNKRINILRVSLSTEKEHRRKDRAMMQWYIMDDYVDAQKASLFEEASDTLDVLHGVGLIGAGLLQGFVNMVQVLIASMFALIVLQNNAMALPYVVYLSWVTAIAYILYSIKPRHYGLHPNLHVSKYPTISIWRFLFYLAALSYMGGIWFLFGHLLGWF